MPVVCSHRSLHAGAYVILALLLLTGVASAQEKPGVVNKYHSFDVKTPVVEEGKYPELTIEDLRAITRYSNLVLNGKKLSVADRGNMTRIEAHPKKKDVLIVTGEYFRFSNFRIFVLMATIASRPPMDSR